MKVGDGVVGIGVDCGGEFAFRLRPLAACAVEGAQFVAPCGDGGLLGDGLLEVGERGVGCSTGGFGACPGLKQGWGELAIPCPGGGIEPGEVGQRFGGRAGLEEREGEIFLGGLVRGLDGESFLELADAFRQLALTDKDCAECAVPLFGCRSEADNFGKESSCGGEVAVIESGDAVAVVGVCGAKARGRLLRVARTHAGDSEKDGCEGEIPVDGEADHTDSKCNARGGVHRIGMFAGDGPDCEPDEEADRWVR